MASHISPKVATADSVQDDDCFFNAVFNLTELDTDLYMAEKSWKPRWARGTYGGLIISHALYAASATVPEGLFLHSMHSYFLRAGDPSISTIYRVQRTRDGQSFHSRTVFAIQKGRPILTLQASFHKEDAEATSVLEYQPVMPIVTNHQKLHSIEECIDEVLSRESVTDGMKYFLKNLKDDQHKSIQRKPVNPDVYLRLAPNPSHTLLVWYKVSESLGDDQNIHRCAAAYISDFTLLGASLPIVKMNMTASLDHSIWFHKPFKMDEWLLYETVGIQMYNSRAFCQGRLWTEDGQLVASVNQEGVARGKL